MSKLLKSKFLLGSLIATSMLLGTVALQATTALGADCAITSTLRVGSKGDQVKCLQSALGLTADGSFGPKTKAAVVAFQASKGLTADGVFGAKSNAAWSGSSAGSTTSMTYPAGCSSSSGYSSTTGASCAGAMTTTTTTYPAGCSSSSGYSSTTGASCATGVTTTTTSSGPVSVALASDTPASQYIIGGQATADLAHFTFTGSGTVNSVILQRTGISDQSTLSNLYLYDGVTRLTDGYSFNNVGQLTMNSLGLKVDGSRTISVKADVAVVTNASTLGITLVSFTASGNPAVTAGVKGNEMTYGSGGLATFAKDSTGTATGATGGNTVGNATVNAGTSSYPVWRQSVQVNTRALWLKAANFRITGSAPSDALGNVNFYVDGVKAGPSAVLTMMGGSNYLSFNMTSAPLSLATGTHTLEVRGDIVKGSSFTVSVSLQQASDVMITDPQVGVNVAMAGTLALGSFTTSQAGTITIGSGSFTAVVDPTFSSMTNITASASNVAIARFKLRGYGEDVKVTSLPITTVLSSPTPAAGGLQNVTVYFNGSQVGTQQSIAIGLNTFSLGSQMIIPAGVDSILEVRADLRTALATTGPTVAAGANYTAGSISANLGAATAEGMNSKVAVTGPTATGTVLTMQAGTLALSKNTGYANSNANPNTAGVKIGSYVLQNQSTSEPIRVTTLLVNTAYGAGTSSANLSGLRTSETSGNAGVPVQPATAAASANANNTFSSDFTLAPGATKTVDVLADSSSDAGTTVTVITSLTVTSIGTISNVSATSAATVGQTITLAVGTISPTAGTTLTAATSTSQQFVPAAGGATDATKATFKITASGGAATISEMKFTVNSQDFSSVGTYDAITTGTGKVFTPTTAADAARFISGDVVQVVASTTNGIGTVTAVSGTTVTVTITVAATGTGSALRFVPATVTNVRVGTVSAAPVSGVAYLTGLSLQVPNGGAGLSQEVYISYAPVGTNGVNTGSTSRVAPESIKYSSGGTTTTMCTAAVSTCAGQVMTAVTASGGVTAPTMKVVGSSPSITVTSTGSILVPGTVEVARVTVAATKGSITLNALPVSITLASAQLTAVGCQANGIIVKDANGNPVTTTNTAVGTGTCTSLTNGLRGSTSTITFTSGYQIDTTQTFKIYVVVDSTDFNSSTAGGAAVAHAATVSTGLGAANLLSWTDTVGNASATTGLDVAGSAVTTVSNLYLFGVTGPGFFYNFPTTTVSVSS